MPTTNEYLPADKQDVDNIPDQPDKPIKFYIVRPEGNQSDGEGVYHLVTEEGEHLASHLCSNSSFAEGDLIDDREERKAEFKDKFGDYEIVWLGNDEMTFKDLVKLNLDRGGLRKEELPQVTLVVEDDDGKEHEVTNYIN